MKAPNDDTDGGHSNGLFTTGSHSSKKVPNPPHDPKETRNPNDPLSLPPGFSSEKYHEFVAAAEKVVGKENTLVITAAAQLTHEHYTDPSKVHDMHNIVEKTYFVASAVLSPRDVPEVQAMMRLCNEFDMPVWPFSIGRK
jgi:hypothetical protein